MAGLLCLVLSCSNSRAGIGGGGGGNGGGGGAVPTSVTLATSTVKVQSGTTFNLTATVHSTNPVTGSVDFIDPASGIPSAQVINGVATEQVGMAMVGTHTITARYKGDSNNQPSQTSGSLNITITGTGQLSVNAAGASSSISVTIQ